jgi:WD40 repeat protein
METEGRGVFAVDFDATHGVKTVVLSADGSRALTGDDGGVVRVWNAATGMQCESALRRHYTDATALAVEFSKATTGYSDRLGRRESTDGKSRSLND